MIPVIAIVGMPNVGKSTLFNCLTQSRSALVADMAGVTRDRQYGRGAFDGVPYVVIDTGGMGDTKSGIPSLTVSQAEQAMQEADVLLFVVDARRGVMPADNIIADKLRKLNKTILLVVNKIDGLDPAIACADFFALGLGKPVPIAASQQQGLDNLGRKLLHRFPPSAMISTETETSEGIKIAIAGKPNVGKSTLVNRLLGEERVIVFDAPGTTRDSIYIPLERAHQKYILIDTAGVRRRSHIIETIEKISVVKTLQAIEDAHVVIFLIDAASGVTEQDLSLLGFIVEAGKALVIAINKWDNLTPAKREEVKRGLDRRLNFTGFANTRFISALHGTGVSHLFDDVNLAYTSATKKHPTPLLNQILQKAIMAHQPPMMQGRRIKLRYAHLGGLNPPVIVVHGNQVSALPETYKRYLASTFRKALRLVGTPVQIQLKEGENPYEKRKNPLKEKHLQKRKRMILHRKKQDKKN